MSKYKIKADRERTGKEELGKLIKTSTDISLSILEGVSMEEYTRKNHLYLMRMVSGKMFLKQ